MVLSSTADVPITIDEKTQLSFLRFGHTDPRSVTHSSDQLPTLENTYAGGMNKIREVQ